MVTEGLCLVEELVLTETVKFAVWIRTIFAIISWNSVKAGIGFGIKLPSILYDYNMWILETYKEIDFLKYSISWLSILISGYTGDVTIINDEGVVWLKLNLHTRCTNL